jgi:DNA-binding MarR family transcriptional regulator
MAGPLPDQGIDLLFLLNQASYALSAEMNRALSDLGISVRDYCVLWKALDGDRTQKEIADAALLDKTTMVTTLDALERAGLAERHPSPTDRRARLVAVTPAGRKAVTQGEEVIEALVADVLGALPATERSEFLAGLTRLVHGRLATPAHAPGPRQRRPTTPVSGNIRQGDPGHMSPRTDLKLDDQ